MSKSPAPRLPAPRQSRARGRQARTSDHVPEDETSQLDTYFSEIAEHDLLTPEEERELAKGMEESECTTWETVLADPATAPVALTYLQEAGVPLDPTPRTRVLRAVEQSAGAALARAAKNLAPLIRAQDLDRAHVKAVVAGLAPEHPARKADRTAVRMRARFVEANLRLVVTMARRYDRGGLPLPDLIQEGNLGLMHAVARFDYRRDLRFSTYACWWIRHTIGRALADKARAIRVPVHMLEARQKAERAANVLQGELGRDPTQAEVSAASRVPIAKLDQIREYVPLPPVSLDSPTRDGSDERPLVETTVDGDTEERNAFDDLAEGRLQAAAVAFLDRLAPMEADVLRQRFGIGGGDESKFREIGEQYGLSRERIRQVQNAALEKMRQMMRGLA